MLGLLALSPLYATLETEACHNGYIDRGNRAGH